MKVPKTVSKIKRRTVLASLAVNTVAFALPDAPVKDEPPLPDWWRKLVADLQMYSNPHPGAGDRWTVVRKSDLDALLSAAGMEVEGGMA